MLIKEISIINPSKTQNTFDFINYIDTSSVEDGTLLNIQNIQDNYPSRAQRQVLNNDILISSVRPNLKHNLFVKNINVKNLVASTGFIQIRCINKTIYPRYLYYFLTSNKNISLYSSIAETSQTTIPSFNKSVIENLSIPDISYSDQLHIVDIIEYL